MHIHSYIHTLNESVIFVEGILGWLPLKGIPKEKPGILGVPPTVETRPSDIGTGVCLKLLANGFKPPTWYSKSLQMSEVGSKNQVLHLLLGFWSSRKQCTLQKHTQHHRNMS